MNEFKVPDPQSKKGNHAPPKRVNAKLVWEGESTLGLVATTECLKLGYSPNNRSKLTVNGNACLTNHITGDWIFCRYKRDPELDNLGYTDACFVGEGRDMIVITCNADRSVREWDPQTGQIIYTIAEASGPPLPDKHEYTRSDYACCIDASRSGRTIVVGDNIGRIRTWTKHGDSWTLSHEIARQNVRMRGVWFCPTEHNQVAILMQSINQQQQTLLVLDTSTKKVVAEWHRLGSSMPGRASFVPNQSEIAVVDRAGDIVLWDTGTGERKTWTPLRAESEFKSVGCACFSPDGKIIATGEDKHGIRLWDFATRELIGVVGRGIASVQLSFSPRGDYLCSYNKHCHIHEWRLVDDKPLGAGKLYDTLAALNDEPSESGMRVSVMRLRDHSSAVSVLCFTGDSSCLLMDGGKNNKLYARDVRSGKHTNWYEGLPDGVICGVDCSPNGALIAAATGSGAMIWDAVTGKPVCRKRTRPEQVAMNALKFYPNSAMCLYGYQSGYMEPKLAYEHEQPPRGYFQDYGSLLSYFSTDFRASVECISYFPHGTLMAIGLGNGSVEICSSSRHSTRVSIAPITGGYHIVDVAVSPDGENLVVAYKGGPIAVYYVTTETNPLKWERVLLDAGPGGVNNVSFFPRGRFFAASGNDSTVQLWDVQTRRQLLALKGHSDAVRMVCFSPNGRKLASTDSCEVFVWDLFDGELCVPLQKRKESNAKYDEITDRLAYHEVVVMMASETNVREDLFPEVLLRSKQKWWSSKK